MMKTVWGTWLVNFTLLAGFAAMAYLTRRREDAARGEAAGPVGEPDRPADPGAAATAELDAALATLARRTGLTAEEILLALLDAAGRRPRAWWP
jgi:hypothetical protein